MAACTSAHHGSWPVHSIQYNLVSTRKEIQTRTAAWINPEDSVLSEINHHRKQVLCGPLLWGSWNRQVIQTEGRRVAPRGWWGDGELVFNWDSISAWEDEGFWRWMVAMVT